MAPRVLSFRIAALIVLATATAYAGAGRPRSRSFKFQYVARIDQIPPGAHRLELWIPVPASDLQQRISELRILAPAPYSLRRDAFLGNRYAHIVINAARVKAPFEVRMSFEATRYEERVDPNADPPGASTAPADLDRWLKPNRLIPINGLIGQLSAEQTKGLTEPLDKARAIYNYVLATMRYDKTGKGWGNGDAIYACTVKKGNCTDFHSLFIGMARAAGIPAKFQIGFPLPPGKHSGNIPGYHCWAFFYLQGVGWVPVDASEAWLDPAQKNYYFGDLDVNRIRFSTGRDLTLDPPQKGPAVNYLIYPYAELDGKPFDGVSHQFSFRDAGRVRE